MWLSKRITRNIKQNIRVWKLFNVVFLSPFINHIWELLQAEFKFLSVVSRHFSRSRAFLAKEILNPMLGQLTALMKWLANTIKRKLYTVKSSFGWIGTV